MFKQSSKSAFNSWFPGRKAVRDRWGEPVSGQIDAREYGKLENVTDNGARMRWSLGHA